MNTVKEYEVIALLVASNGAEWTESAWVEAKTLTEARAMAKTFAREIRNESNEPNTKIVDAWAINLDTGECSD